MLLTLQKYTYNVVYCPGSRLVITDALSRAYLPHGTAADFSEDVAAIAAAAGEQCNALRTVASPATVELLRRTAEADDDYLEILERIHSSHIGVNGCLRRAKEAVYYPGITADIKKTVAA